MAIAFVAIMVLLEELPKPARKVGITEPLRALSHRGLLITGLVALFYNFGFFTLLAYTPFPLEMGAHALGLVFFGWGLMLAISSVFAAPPLKRRFGVVKTLGAMYAALALILAIMGFGTGSPALLAVAVIAAGAVLGVVNTVLTEAVMRVAPVERPIASSAYSFVRFAGGAVAPWLAGKLAEWVAPDTPFFVGAAAVLVALGVLVAGRALLRRGGGDRGRGRRRRSRRCSSRSTAPRAGSRSPPPRPSSPPSAARESRSCTCTRPTSWARRPSTARAARWPRAVLALRLAQLREAGVVGGRRGRAHLRRPRGRRARDARPDRGGRGAGGRRRPARAGRRARECARGRRAGVAFARSRRSRTRRRIKESTPTQRTREPDGFLRQRTERAVAKVIAFANQKGGVAKTTTTLNLAAAFAEEGHRVLCIDMDPQGNLTMSQGIDPETLDESMFDVLVHDMPIQQVIYRCEIDVAVASIDLAGAEIAMSVKIGRERSLDKALRVVHDDYDFICIDTPPSLGLLTVNALTAADKVIVPVQCEYLSMRGLLQLQNTLSMIRENLNPDVDIMGILPTMVDTRTLHAKEAIEILEENFGDRVFGARIKKTVRFAEAPVKGMSVLKYDPNGQAADSYRRLAKEVLSNG